MEASSLDQLIFAIRIAVDNCEKPPVAVLFRTTLC